MRLLVIPILVIFFHAFSLDLNDSIVENETVEIRCKSSLKKLNGERKTFVIKKRIDLKGEKIVIPANCTLQYNGGFFTNGEIVFNETLLDGDIRFMNHVMGSVTNDTINLKWFQYKDSVLFDIFKLAENKVVRFDNNSHFDVDYLFLIPNNCIVLGGNSVIKIGIIDQHSPISNYVKIRNKHFDGGGNDSFIIKDLKFVSESDSTFLFSMRNISNVQLTNCSFVCSGYASNCMHSFDISGNAKNIIIEDCSFINMSGAKAGGGLWLRSFGRISNVRIKHCIFRNNTTDEAFAMNAVDGDIENIILDSCSFYYERADCCPFPHVFWGMTRTGDVYCKNISITKTTLTSNYVPSYVLNTNMAENVKVSDCVFSFKDFSFHNDQLTTTSFNGKIYFENCVITLEHQLLDDDPTSQVNLFSSEVTVRKSIIMNDSYKCHLGAPSLFDSVIFFDNSQLFNGYLPKIMKGNRVHLGKGTPFVAVNPYSHKGESVWIDNSFEAVDNVSFILNYSGLLLNTSNNQLKNIISRGSVK